MYIYDVCFHVEHYSECNQVEFSNPVHVGQSISNGDCEYIVFQIVHSSVGGGSALHVKLAAIAIDIEQAWKNGYVACCINLDESNEDAVSNADTAWIDLRRPQYEHTTRKELDDLKNSMTVDGAVNGPAYLRAAAELERKNTTGKDHE